MRNLLPRFVAAVALSTSALLTGCAAQDAEAEDMDVAVDTQTGAEAQGLNFAPASVSPIPNLKLAPFVLSAWGALPTGYSAPTVVDTTSAGPCVYRAGYIVSTDPNLLGEHKVFVQSAQEPRSATACSRTGYIIVGKSYDPPQVELAARPTGTTATSTDFVVGYTRKTTPLCDPIFDYALTTFSSAGFVKRNAKITAIALTSKVLSGVVNVVAPSGAVTVHGIKTGAIAGEVVPAYGTYVDGSHYKAAFNGDIFDTAGGVLLPASVEAY